MDTAKNTLSFSEVERWGLVMVAVTMGGVDHYVGSHLASLLNRETFNLYGSLKRRGISVFSVDERLLRWLVANGVVSIGTTSATLVCRNEVEGYVEAEMQKKGDRGRKRGQWLDALVKAVEEETYALYYQ
jgi:hypothetical protein